ncbi:unnamed protein product [Effrenium voratum]|nr:unnamed protein product [Effrenium voratum]
MKRIRLPEDCVRLIEKEVKDKEEHAEHANGIREKMYDRVCGAADNVFEILRRLRRTEDWWDRHEVVEEVVQEKYSDLRPVLVFVNTRSGGQQGSKILHEMQEYLHAAQVVELQREGPDAALQWWDKTKLPYRILVCGGDGTAGWVLGALEQLKAEDKLSQTQPLGILPIGTGNDLARVLNWGGGYTNSSVLPALQQMRSAKTKLLDRWRVLCRDKKKEDMEEPAGDKDELGQGEDKEEKEERDKEEPGDKVKWVSRPHFLPVQPDRKIMAMSNYLGIGVDAAVAMDFHQMRERRPGLFVSQLVNKLWYFRSGYRNWMTKHCANIGEKMELFCDGHPVDIPSSLEGIIILNIPSFGGGTDLWGRAEDDDGELDSDSDSTAPSESSAVAQTMVKGRQSMQDKLLEVVGVDGALQLGASQVGLYTATQLAQASSVKIINKVTLPMEVDGEPSWLTKDGVIEITHKSQAYVLARCKKRSSHAVATNVIDWAAQKNIITAEQRNLIQHEIAHRAGDLDPARKTGSWARLHTGDDCEKKVLPAASLLAIVK